MKSYKFYLFILRGILKTKIEYVFFSETSSPRNSVSTFVPVFFAHILLQSTTVVVLQLQPYIYSFKTATELFDIFLFLIHMRVHLQLIKEDETLCGFGTYMVYCLPGYEEGFLLSLSKLCGDSREKNHIRIS